MRHLALLALALLLLPGCALLGPDKEEVLVERHLWDMAEEALNSSDALHEASLAQLRDYALVQALEGNRQAALDDTHMATVDGQVPAAEVERIQAWLLDANAKESARIWAAYNAGLNPKSRADFKEVLWKMRALRMSRLSAEDLKLESLDFLMQVGKDVGIIKEGE